MRKLTLTQSEFLNMLSGLVSSGVTFESEINRTGHVVVEFTGGY